jgi:hypothetical protein
MPDIAVERLFSLFTSSDRAEAIAGDLAEEREQHGWSWFCLHVARITLALWRNAVTDAPIVVLLVAVAGCALFAAPAFGGLASVYLFPYASDSPVTWIALSLFWWGGALGTGMSLVGIAPQRGMAACATLAVAAEALLIGLGMDTTGLLVPMWLLAGAAIARRRTIGCGIRALEQGR